MLYLSSESSTMKLPTKMLNYRSQSAMQIKDFKWVNFLSVAENYEALDELDLLDKNNELRKAIQSIKKRLSMETQIFNHNDLEEVWTDDSEKMQLQQNVLSQEFESLLKLKKKLSNAHYQASIESEINELKSYNKSLRDFIKQKTRQISSIPIFRLSQENYPSQQRKQDNQNKVERARLAKLQQQHEQINQEFQKQKQTLSLMKNNAIAKKIWTSNKIAASYNQLKQKEFVLKKKLKLKNNQLDEFKLSIENLKDKKEKLDIECRKIQEDIEKVKCYMVGIQVESDEEDKHNEEDEEDNIYSSDWMKHYEREFEELKQSMKEEIKTIELPIEDIYSQIYLDSLMVILIQFLFCQERPYYSIAEGNGRELRHYER